MLAVVSNAIHMHDNSCDRVYLDRPTHSHRPRRTEMNRRAPATVAKQSTTD
jgi:hypothetical protein